MRITATFLLLMLLQSPAAAQSPEPPERPQRPAVSLSEADCLSAEKRAPLIADPMAFIATVSAYGLALNAYSEQLMAWRNGQLRAGGRWTDADEERFGLALLGNPAFMAEASAAMHLALDAMAPMERFAEGGRTAEDKCRDLLETQGLFERMADSVERQWRMIDEAFEAEAVRIGIAID